MHLRDSGIFDVDPSERITFTVTRKDPQNKAAFAPTGFTGVLKASQTSRRKSGRGRPPQGITRNAI